MKLNVIIYDCEIILAIPNRDGGEIEGIEYCEGWRDFKKMGVSVTCVYDYHEDRYRVFCEDNKSEFHALLARDPLCVGFNSIPFDNELLSASVWPFPVDSQSYDLLREIWAAQGLGPEFNFKTHGGVGLDAMCKCNFGTRKSGNGAVAPVLWQQGKRGEVIDYCLNDIRLTKQLFDAILLGPIKNPNGGMLTLLDPLDEGEKD